MELSQQPTILPLEILSVAHDISALHSWKKITQLLKKTLNSEQPTLCRIALTSIRFLGSDYMKHFTEDVLKKTHHSDPWVRYDAVWVLGELPCQDSVVKQRLYTMAGYLALCPLSELEQIQASSPEEQTRIKAAKSYRHYLRQHACAS